MYSLLLACRGQSPDPTEACPDPAPTAMSALPVCDEAAPVVEDSFESSLSERGACGDAYYYGVDAGHTVRLAASVQGLVAAALDVDQGYTCELGLPNADVSLTLATGDGLATGCEGTKVEEEILCTWLPSAGSVSFEMTPASDGTAQISARFSDLVLENELGDSVTIAAVRLDGEGAAL